MKFQFLSTSLAILAIFATTHVACQSLKIPQNENPKKIQKSYVPAPEAKELGEEELKNRETAEKLDTHKMLYTGKVVVDQDKSMLEPPERVAQYEGDEYVMAETPPMVEFGVIPATPFWFPEPVDDHHRAMWANWGQSAYYPKNGHFYTSIGDNGSYDAHLYVVEYDPEAKEIGLSAEVNEVIGRPDDMFSEGKIHGWLDFIEGPELWFCTYWSKYPEVHEEDWQTGYRGGHIMTYNVETGDFTDYGVPMPRASWPASRVDPNRRMLYATGYYCEFLAWDIDNRKVHWAGHQPDGIQMSNRVLLIDDKTGMLYTSNRHEDDHEKHFIKYDPYKNRFELTEMAAPPTDGQAGEMRASTIRRNSDGIFYGVTTPGQMFTFDPDKEEIVDLGLCWPGEERYTTSLETSPGERYIYYVPGAHGKGCLDGSPLVQYDTKTQTKKVLAFLSPFYEEKYGYTPSGSFSLKLDDKGERVFIIWNGGFFDYDPENPGSLFKHNAIMLVHIPESEREE
ncbi:MAG: hypothetical protein KC944_00660 [Candidatus Omnitrophica bacterium]|nr:hypothetical protein [Candidatus Omnitrophota bacterium]